MNALNNILRYMPILIMSLLSLGTYWLVKATTPQTQETRAKQHIPDYIVDGVTMTSLRADGSTKSRILSRKLVHFEDDLSSHLEYPIARQFNPGKPAVTVRSDTGILNGDMSLLNLIGNATLIRPNQPATDSMQALPRLYMASSHFTVFLNDDVVKTTRPVTLEQGLSIMTSQEGAIYDNVRQKLTMIGTVRGRLEVEKK
jgi:lipopolysaccharide export system protein LptC